MSARTFSLLAVIALLLFSIPAFAADWGEIRKADRNLNVRKEPSPTSEHVVTLKKGQQVKVDFKKKNGWVAIFKISDDIRDESRAIGYANSKYLVLMKKNKSAPAKKVESKYQENDLKEKPVMSLKPGKAAKGTGKVTGSVAGTPPIMEPAGSSAPGVPVKITSERMTYDESKRIVSFAGNVVAKHEGLTLWADTISAYFSGTGGKNVKVDSIDRVVARGNVRAEKGKTTGSCGKVTYKVEERILIMEENPILNDGPNSLSGDVIRYFVRENRSEVVGGKGKRVEAIFFTPKGMKVQ